MNTVTVRSRKSSTATEFPSVPYDSSDSKNINDIVINGEIM